MASRPDMLTRAQAAKYLGVSVSWLQTHMADGPTATRVGRKVFYLQADLDAYIASRRGRGMTQILARRDTRKAAKGAVTKAVPSKVTAAATKSMKAAPQGGRAPTKGTKAATKASPVRTPSGAHEAVARSRPVGTSVLQQLLESVRDMAPIGKAISSAKPPPLPQRASAPPKRPEPPARPPTLPSSRKRA